MEENYNKEMLLFITEQKKKMKKDCRRYSKCGVSNQKLKKMIDASTLYIDLNDYKCHWRYEDEKDSLDIVVDTNAKAFKELVDEIHEEFDSEFSSINTALGGKMSQLGSKEIYFNNETGRMHMTYQNVE